jgi:hypothetical protein
MGNETASQALELLGVINRGVWVAALLAGTVSAGATWFLFQAASHLSRLGSRAFVYTLAGFAALAVAAACTAALSLAIEPAVQLQARAAIYCYPPSPLQAAMPAIGAIAAASLFLVASRRASAG